MDENKQVAQSGGNAANLARRDIEKQIGHSIISPQRASDYLIEDTEATVIDNKYSDK